MVRYLIILLLAAVAAPAQDFLELRVPDFSGGQVNSLANSLMKENQALILENYDVTPFGALKRRPGFSAYGNFAVAAQDAFRGIALAPYYGRNEKELLLTARAIATGAPRRTDIGYLLKLNPSTNNFGDSLYWRLYNPLRNYRYPANASFQNYHNHLIIAASKSEMLVYDGTELFPARPLGPGQPKVTVIDGTGHINTPVQYIYAFYDPTTTDTSPTSTPSWTVHPDYGSVLIEMDEPLVGTVTEIFIFRSDNGGAYRHIKTLSFPGGDGTVYLDTLATASGTVLADTTRRNLSYYDPGIQCLFEFLTPPGGFTFTLDTLADGIWDSLPADSLGCPMLTYAVQFIDSAGRKSYLSPFCSHRIYDTLSDTSRLTLSLSNLPVSDNPKVSQKIVWRKISGTLFLAGSAEISGLIGSWYKVATLSNLSTTWTDNAPVKHYADSVNENNYRYYSPSNFTHTPESLLADDSVVTFQPSDIVIHGDRLFAIGNPANRNYLYYSEFGRPTTFPYDKFILFDAPQGEWFQRIISLGNVLIGFRQNSIMELRGLSFYQFQANDVVRGIGISAPRSLAFSNGALYFAHESGVYQYGSLQTPLSFPIEYSLDSVGNYIGRAYGQVVNGEYWFSCAVGDTLNNKTYIFNPSPSPHWKVYSFGIIDAKPYDLDTLNQNYLSRRWLMVGATSGQVCRWNYSATDTTDAGAAFTAKYQSKYFFTEDDPKREKIAYIDIFGKGICDSLKLTLYDQEGQRTVGSYTVRTDFDSGKPNRVAVNRIITNLSVRIEDFGKGNYTLTGYNIGFRPWDGGQGE